MQGLIGKKLGMTQVYDGNGRRVAVTVIEAGPCVVTQCKTAEKDGYTAVQIGFGDLKESRAAKPQVGRAKKAGVALKRVLREFEADPGETLKPGDTVTAAIFEKTSHVDVMAVSKGKGFQGVVRRHSMSGGPLSHGGHSKRRIGSIGQRTWTSKVAKGKRMPGHMGHVQVTTQTIPVVRVDAERNLLLVNGAVPGPVGGVVLVRRALKRKAGQAA